MRTELIERCVCSCGHRDFFHREEGDDTKECSLCKCTEYTEVRK